MMKAHYFVIMNQHGRFVSYDAHVKTRTTETLATARLFYTAVGARTWILVNQPTLNDSEFTIHPVTMKVKEALADG
jgi:hypothetical protein